MGSQIKIVCYTFSVPDWFFNGEYFVNSSRVNVDGSVILIESLQFGDEGSYECYGTYMDGIVFVKSTSIFVSGEFWFNGVK